MVLADTPKPYLGSPIERAYLDLLHEIMETGEDQTDRTGTGTRGVFGRQIRCDLSDGFPLLTTKKVHFKSIAVELLWFIKGITNVKWLQERGVSIWDEWADENGELGPVYGKQWRRWEGPDGREIDQLAGLIDQIRQSPDSRRHIISARAVGGRRQIAASDRPLRARRVAPDALPAQAGAAARLRCERWRG